MRGAPIDSKAMGALQGARSSAIASHLVGFSYTLFAKSSADMSDSESVRGTALRWS
jgi:hypothetical protein